MLKEALRFVENASLLNAPNTKEFLAPAFWSGSLLLFLSSGLQGVTLEGRSSMRWSDMDLALAFTTVPFEEKVTFFLALHVTGAGDGRAVAATSVIRGGVLARK